MAHLRHRRILLAFLLLAAIGASRAGKVPLSDEPSRDDLAQYAASLEPPTRAFPYEFKFPDDVRTDKVFGIDVSHYQEKVEWEKVAKQGIRFVYIKATQGTEYYDPTFERNWSAAGKIEAGDQSLRRGAYHFLTADGAPQLQAKNFLDTVGSMAMNDLPPCVDLEWDWLVKDRKYAHDRKGRKVDAWASLSPAEIAERVITWLRLVEDATGKKPIIYTTSSWWSSRVGPNSSLRQYSFWIADYTSKSLGREDPNVPERLSWSFWQLTDRGLLRHGGIDKHVDTTVFHGSPDDLNKQFGFQ